MIPAALPTLKPDITGRMLVLSLLEDLRSEVIQDGPEYKQITAQIQVVKHELSKVDMNGHAWSPDERAAAQIARNWLDGEGDAPSTAYAK